MTTEDTIQRLESLLRRSMKSLLKTEGVLEAERAARREPIAIVSMACRLPGGIDGPEAYWQLLEEGQDAVEAFPARWEGFDLYDPNPDALGKSYAREGGFMRDVESFDAGFFGTGAREARAMDPQQRLLLETAWEALERGGIQPSSLNESLTGVYVGAMNSDYGSDQMSGLEALDGYVGTGRATSVLSGRVAYVLGLQGPALTVDTACSSSLTALHLACAGLRQRECDLALAGGVTVMSTPGTFVEFSRLRAIAPDGRCKSFSARADGTGCSEGCGVLVLKRLSDAQRDGDRVLALIRSSAVNQDGRSQGLSAPNGPSQQRVIRDALSSSGLSPSDIDAVEAHGTGTMLGDPIEAGALSAVFRPERAPDHPLYLGSSKSNLGHTQAAAGVTGVIKMVLSLQHELLPKTLHAEEPSPHVAWEDSGLSLLREARVWKRGERVRRAGVSSFGISGTNAHVVLEEAPRRAAAEEASGSTPVAHALPLLVSGRDDTALRSQAERLRDWLSAHPAARWADVVHTAALHRTHFDERAVLMAPDVLSSVEALEALAQGRHDARVVRGTAGVLGKVVFVFPGQGSQWQGMGKPLFTQSKVFAQSVRACDAALLPWTGWSVEALLRGDGELASDLREALSKGRPDVVQPVIFTMAIALTAVWRELGIEPVAVVGFSQGEIPAAVIAGALSLSDGAQVVAVRSRMLTPLMGKGATLMVAEPHERVAQRIASYGEALSIAAVNDASSTLVSGTVDAVKQLTASLESEGVFCRLARTSDVAAHSAQMNHLLPGLLEKLSALSPHAGTIPIYSTVEGRRLEGAELNGAYWCRNLREPVRLDRALTQLQEDGYGVFVEVSAHPLLSVPLRSASEARGGLVIGSLSREQGDFSSLLRGLGELHAHGHVVDWKRALSECGGARIELPTYAFQRERFWLEAGKGRSDARSLGLASAEHPLLGALTPLADSDGYLFSSLLSLREHAWLRDHAVAGTALLPGVSMLELALHAGRALGFGVVRELVSAQPLALPADGGVQLQLSVGYEEEAGKRSISLYSRTGEGAWVQNATGELGMSAGPQANAELEELRSWPVAHSEPVDLTGFYARAAQLGLEYGPAFQGLLELRRAGQVAYGRVVLPDSLRASAEHYDLHPALFDAAMHPLLAFIPEDSAGEVLLPFAWSDVQLYATGASELRVRAELKRDEATGQLTAAITISDGAGEPVAQVGAVRVRTARLDELRRLQSKQSEHLYRVNWQPVSLEVTTAGEEAVVLGGSGGLARQLGVTWYAELEALLAGVRDGLRPTRVIVDATRKSEAALVPALHARTVEALSQLQALLSEPGLSESELVWVTSSALGWGADPALSDLVHAPVWGLLRAARSEHAERSLRLVDLEDVEPERELLARGLSASRESELVLRGGAWLAARLMRAGVAPQDSAAEVRTLNPAGTVLITGGTGELGSALAEHLVAHHGVKHLVLTSRRGGDAPGTEALIEKLSGLGAHSATVLSCDVTVRSQVATVLAQIPNERPLTGVFHLSAALEDGLLQTQTAERLSAVLAPKVDGAWHLHELTESQDLACFVLFSSVAGTLGSAGQSNYAAANTFLDALAAHRKTRGLSGTSLAWGLWQPSGAGLTASLTPADLMRIARAGIAPLTAAQALALLDAALSRPEPQLVPIRLDLATLQRTFEQAGVLPSLWRSLLRPSLPKASLNRSGAASALRARLASLAESERLAVVVELVQGEIATVLGLPGPSAVPADKELMKLGLDSLMAVELRNRLSALAGTKLPATLAFDYPTPGAIGGWLLSQAFNELLPVRAPRKLAASNGAAEPIAIVSMACRLPGGIADPEAYWQLLQEGRDAVEAFPPRWEHLDLYDPNPDAVGKSYAREGGFLHDIALFDAGFFGTGVREARAMDPQQRLLLETAWEALERAGIQPSSLNESLTGVYVGCMGSDYGVVEGRGLETLDGYVATGSATSVLSGRVAYVLGLQGPAMTIDTACSSSLTALHLACTALRQRECDLALAGGVTVMSAPGMFVEFSRLRAMAPDGRCKSFSARADGAGWSEGCGVLVLKRLSDAQRDGDQVLALVRSSAINQDGRSQGLSAPNGPSQQRVIRDALSLSGLSASDIDAVEAHGTGTPLGDPIEAGALSAVFGPERAPDHPLYLGSSKSNLGHTQAAAGVTGVIKMVLSLEHELLPKTLHAEELSPHIAWEDSGLSPLQEARAWKRGERIRRAGVSSFGISGTNAHVVLEEAPSPARVEAAHAADVPYALPLLVSGRDEAALCAQADRLGDWLREHAEARVADVVHTAALHRTHFDERAVVMVRDVRSSVQALEALAQGRHDARVVRGRARTAGKVVFVFPGQGSQWEGMGKALIEQSRVFAESVQACDAALLPWTGWSVAALLRGDAEASSELQQALSKGRPDVVQPVIFTMAIALTAVWRELGIEPVAVVGFSQGEIPAAVVAGALSLSDGAQIVAVRSRMLTPLMGQGATLMVAEPHERVAQRLASYGEALSIAAVNDASSTLVSGTVAAVKQLTASLEVEGVFCRLARTSDVAAHSAQMDHLLPGLLEKLSALSPRAGKIPIYSTVEGRRLEGTELDGAYWCRNLREPVRLDRALTQLLEDEYAVFVEVSAHPVLGVPLRNASEARGGVVIGSLAREQGEFSSLLSGLGELHAHGHVVDWKQVLSEYGGARIQLPTYAFQREHFWVEAGRGRSDARSMGLVSVEHPWLGALTPLADSDGYAFSSQLSLSEQSWLADHAVQGTVLVPGTGLLELALHAARTLGLSSISELMLEQPLILSRDRRPQLQVSVGSADAQGERSVNVYTRDDEHAGWQRHASGSLHATSSEGTAVTPEFESLRSWPPTGAEPVSLDGFYAKLRELGLEYGPSFQGLAEAYRAGTVAYGRVVLPEPVKRSAEQYGVHPALLDAALHLMLVMLSDEADSLHLPFAWSDVQLHATGATELRVRMERTGQFGVSVLASDGAGEPVASIGALQVRPARRADLQVPQRGERQHLYRVEFQPVPLPVVTNAVDFQAAAVLGGTGALAQRLGVRWYADLDALRARGDDEPAPDRVIVDATERVDGAVVSAVHAQTAAALALLQALLADARLEQSELVWVTSSAVASGAEQILEDLVHAPLWGLIRAARNESVDRSLRLIDIDDVNAERELLTRGLWATRESELALRGDAWLAARLTRASGESTESARRTLDERGTVLITGGTGELGSALAEHLVSQHAVQHLVLTSRRGSDAPGTAELIAKLSTLGAAHVEVLACDVTVRSQVAAVLARVPSEHPLTGVFHLPVVLDDGLVQAQTAERLSPVLAPKVDGAWHLHELTQAADLACFVMFSSAAGTIGSPGQSNYAAANTFLDALAAHRRKRGLPATSLAWGLWQPSGTGLTARLTPADLSRMARAGFGALSQAEGLALLDAALARPEPHLVAMRLEFAVLQRRFEQGVPALWSALLRPGLRKASTTSQHEANALRARVATLPEAERLELVLETVQGEIAQVLGLPGPSAVPADKELMKLGLDSLMAVELRNRLSTFAGSKLPATLAFDYPTPTALAGMLLKRIGGSAEEAAKQRPPKDPQGALGWALSRVSARQLEQTGLLSQILAIALGGSAAPGEAETDVKPVKDMSRADVQRELRAKLEKLRGV